MGRDGICKYLPLQVYPIFKYACVCCFHFVTINLRCCGKPGTKLVVTLLLMLHLVCYVWLYYS